jgi:hypothetical protein
MYIYIDIEYFQHKFFYIKFIPVLCIFVDTEP